MAKKVAVAKPKPKSTQVAKAPKKVTPRTVIG